MKDFLMVLMKYVPAYLTEMCAIVSSPLRHLAKVLADPKMALQQALAFALVTFALMNVLLLPVLPSDNNLWAILGSGALKNLGVGVVFAVPLFWCFRIVGGKAEFLSILTIYAYSCAGAMLISGIGTSLQLAVTENFSPAMYKVQISQLRHPWKFLHEAPSGPSPTAGPGLVLVLFLIMAVSSVLSLVWSFIIWEAFRRVNHLSVGLGVLAFLCHLLCSTVIVLVLMGCAELLVWDVIWNKRDNQIVPPPPPGIRQKFR